MSGESFEQPGHVLLDKVHVGAQHPLDASIGQRDPLDVAPLQPAVHDLQQLLLFEQPVPRADREACNVQFIFTFVFSFALERFHNIVKISSSKNHLQSVYKFAHAIYSFISSS